jgi:hypothetical protein
MKEFSGGRVGNTLTVESPPENCEQSVEFFGFDHRPWYDVELPAMQTRDEVGTLLFFADLL